MAAGRIGYVPLDVVDAYSDEDEDFNNFIHFVERPRRQNIARPRLDYFVFLDDLDFFMRFRLTKQSVWYLLTKIEHLLETPTDRNRALTPMDQILLTLRFYAQGCMLITAGDFMGVHKSTAGRIVHKVTHVIAGLAPEFIKFPETRQEMQQVQQEFFNIAAFPRVIGSIDCTHVKIQSPGGENAEYFRNRKGYFSLNVQTVCDARLRIQDIVASWPGSQHDATIFNASVICHRFERGDFGESLLVGDSGYPVRNYLIPPLANPTQPVHELFNEAQIRTRNPVERSYGVWKRRFPILALGIRVSLDKTMAIIVATAVLHNIACNMQEADPPLDPGLELIEEDIIADVNPPARAAYANNNRVRQALIEEYFARLM